MSDAAALAWLDRLLDLNEIERATQLQQLLLEDPALHARLIRLLAAAEADESSLMLARPVVESLRASQDAALFSIQSGHTFAGYRLLREIGRGGMSVIWLAERADGVVKREVALKLPLLVLNSAVDIDRFDREKDALAALTHPNIARLYDAGVTPSGQPFLVLEYVDGLPITKYCDQQRMHLSDRLELFRQVLAAVEHAHKHLIVHRDLKPSNILVDVTGQVKLLDFGIAKVLESRALSEGGALTVTAAALMTPEYASPEQFRNETITTATDVYSLGCVLYELLTGQKPIGFASRIPHEIAQAVLTKEPDKPSTRIARLSSRTRGLATLHSAQDELARFGEGSTPRLQRRLRGDLDNIVMKAIRKEPSERFESVGQFSEDIRRHLHAEPVLARGSSAGYRLGKFITRHKLVVAASAIVLISIAAGLAMTVRQARIARANELRAEQRFAEVRHLANSMMFEIHDSIAQLPGATPARQLIVVRAQEYLERLTWDANTDPSLLRELAAAHTRLATVLGNPSNANLGDTQAAIKYYRKAIALLELVAARDPKEVATARDLALNYTRLAMALAQTDDTRDRKLSIEKALGILEPATVATPDDQSMARNLAFAYSEYALVFRNLGELDRALAYFAKAQDGYRRLHQTYPDMPLFEQNLSHSHRHIGTVLALQKRYPEALENYRIAGQMNAARLAKDPQNAEAQFNVSLSDSNIAFVLGEQGDIDGALRYYGNALQTRSALLNADPKDERARTGLAETLNYIGVNLARKKDYEGALKTFKESMAVRELLAKNNPGDETHGIELAWIDAKIGRTYANLALLPNTKPAKKSEYCKEARERIQRALPKWAADHKQVRLGAGSEQELVELKQAIIDCKVP